MKNTVNRKTKSDIGGVDKAHTFKAPYGHGYLIKGKKEEHGISEKKFIGYIHEALKNIKQ